MLEDEEEIAHKFIQLEATSMPLFPELFNKKMTFMQLLTAEGETSKNKVSTITPGANLQLSK